LQKHDPLLLISSGKLASEWSPDNHPSYLLAFRKAIFTFLLCLRRFRASTGLKLPKFVLFDIIKQIYRSKSAFFVSSKTISQNGETQTQRTYDTHNTSYTKITTK